MGKTIFIETIKTYAVEVKNAEDAVRLMDMLFAVREHGFSGTFEGHTYDLKLTDLEWNYAGTEDENGNPLFTKEEWDEAYKKWEEKQKVK